MTSRLEIETIKDGDLLGWSWLFPPYSWHFSCSRDQADERDLFLRHDPARVLRKGSHAWLRALQAHERGDDARGCSWPARASCRRIPSGNPKAQEVSRWPPLPYPKKLQRETNLPPREARGRTEYTTNTWCNPSPPRSFSPESARALRVCRAAPKPFSAAPSIGPRPREVDYAYAVPSIMTRPARLISDSMKLKPRHYQAKLALKLGALIAEVFSRATPPARTQVKQVAERCRSELPAGRSDRNTTPSSSRRTDAPAIEDAC